LALNSGARLGSHEILGLLGAGGVGEVYRALDTRLNRQVAFALGFIGAIHVNDGTINDEPLVRSRARQWPAR
jgi:serine/threonine protein kinase